MASFSDLRPRARSAKAGTTAVRRLRSLKLLAVSAVLLFTAFLAVSELATLRGTKAHDASAYLTRELGSPLSSASLVRAPARNVRVRIRKGGFELRAPEGRLTLVAQAAGTASWRHFQHGALRSISIGQEAVTVRGDAVEESLRVLRRHGRHTWRWRLDSSLHPRLSNGVVAFFDGRRMVDYRIDRVRIYDDAGRNVTPSAAHWSLVRRAKVTWLELTLDDSNLPTPYTIDPAVLRTAGAVATGNGTFNVGIPNGVQTGDLLVLVLAQAVNSAPATPTGWTLVPSSSGTVGGGGTKIGYATFFRKGLSSDSGTNASVTTTGAAVGEIFVYRGVDTSLSGACPGATCMIRDAPAAGPTGATSTTLTFTGFTTSIASEEVLATGAALLNVNWPAASTTGAFTRRSPANANNGTTISLGLYDKNVASTPTAVSGTVGIGTSAKNLGFMFGLTNDTTSPTSGSETIGGVSPAGVAYQPSAGGILYYNGNVAGQFTISDPITDAQSGPQSVGYPAVATSGWTHASETVSTGAGYTSSAYQWSAGTHTPPTAAERTLTEKDNADNAVTSNVVSIVDDSTAPTGGALTVNGGAAYSTTGNFPIDTRTNYTETQSATASGLASSTLVRTSAAFTSADTCGSFGSPTTLVGTPAQSGLTTGCYTYTLTGTDNVGNTVSISQTVKVDMTDPSAPAFSYANIGGGAYYPGSGTRVYFKPNAANGTFDITAASTDNDTGIGSYTFPAGSALGTNWTGSGSGATRTYSYTATATTNGSQSVSATNNAGRSASSTFDVTLDSTAPAGGALTVNGGAAYSTTGNFPIDTRTDYAETQSATASGLASSTLVRTSAAFTSADTCGSFGSPTTLVGTPAQSGLATGCYMYTLTGTDNVGNTVSISQTVKVDTTDPSAPTLSFSNAGGGTYYPGSGTRFYFKPDAANGTIDVAASSTDNDTGIGSYTFPSGATLGTNWSSSGSGSSRTYSYTATATTNGSQSVSATDNAGRSASSSFDPVADSTPPGGGAVTVNGGSAYSSTGTFSIGTRTDYTETQTAAAAGLATSTLVRTSASFTSADTCGSFGSPTTLVGTPAQNGLATGCYRYTLTGTDNVGNAASVSTTVKVDTSDPSAPALTPSNATGGAYYPGSGTRVYFKPDAAAGGFDIAASSTDNDSGIGSYTFPSGAAIGTNWSVSGAGSSRSYSYTATATTNGTQNVTATNNAGRTSSGSTFDVTLDSTAPAGGALTVNGGAAYSSTGSFPIDIRTDYTEAQSATASGLAASTLVRTSAAFASADTCGSFGSPTTLVGTPAQNGLASGCYKYTLTGTDNVGNAVSVSSIVKIDTSDPSAPNLSFSNFTGTTSATGSTVYFLPTTTGSFDVTASSSDNDSGIAGYTFPSAASFGSGWSISGSGSTRTYSYTAGSATPAPQSVTATNNAGLTASSGFTVVVSDTTPPTTTVQCNGAACQGGFYSSAPVAVTLSADDGAQGSGVDVIRYTVDGSDPSPVNGADYIGPIDIVATSTVKFRAYDNLGNEEAVGSQLVQVDAAPPTGQTITLTGSSAPYYTSSSVTFTTANGSDADSGLDPSSAAVTRETGDLAGDSCTNFTADAGTFSSPDAAVSGGHCYRYTFTIADNVGHVSAPVTATAKVDLDSPSVSLTDPGTPVAGTVSLGATASDASTGIQQVVFERSPAGASTWTTIGTDTSAPYTASWNTGVIADGLYDLRAVATDIVGHTQADLVASRRVDNTAPDTSIDSGPPNPSNDATPAFAFSSSETGSTFECRIDGGSWSPCASPYTTAALAEGSHTFDVRATDQAGNTDGTPGSQTWTIDLTAPDTTIDSTPPALGNDATPTFDFSSTEGGSTFECRVDAGSWSPCTSPHTTSSLLGGSHTFDVRATDQAGNTDGTPAAYTWSVDLNPPSVAITAPTTYINASDPSIYTVTASTPDGDVAHIDFYECSNASVGCSTGTWNQFDSDGTAPFTGSWATPGTDGARAIRAVAVDGATNSGADVRTITIDRTPPSGVTASYPNGYVAGSFAITTSNGPDADVDGSTATLERQTGTLASDTCSSYSGWTPASSPDSVASGHCAVYRYRIADQAGNWTTATSLNEVKSDTNAPTSAQDDPGANLRGAVTLTSSASDSGGSGLASVAFEQRPAGGGSWTTVATDTGAPFSASFDTTSVADGLYDFRTVATDVAGSTEASPVVVANRRIDNTAPTATMQSPGNPVRGTVTLTSNTSDGGSGLNTVTYELAPHGGSFNTQPAVWDTTLGADGLYDVRVIATDVAGNSTTSALVTTRVDNTPPALTFSSPATGAAVSGTVPLTASASDASPASPPISFFYKLHSAPASAYTSTGASWDTTALPAGDGLYDLRAIATDDASNTTTVDNTSVQVDNVPPLVAITAPATAINGSLPTPTSFSATANDPSGSGVQDVQFFECSDQSVNCSTGVWSPLGTVPAPGPYTVSWNIPGVDGNHALAAVATDYAGHATSAIRNVDVDRTAPDSTITAKPADPSNAASPSFAFSSDEAGSTFECSIDGGSWSPCTSPDSLGGLSDGSHTFDVRATDPAGNTDASPDTWAWHRDTTGPSGTLNDPGANVRQTVTLTSTENDPLSGGYASGVNSVSYEYSSDGTTWATIGTLSSAPFDTLPWDTTGVADGVYQLRIVVHDVAGNSTPSAAVTNIRVDNTPPTTSQNDPGQYLRGTKTLDGSAADSGSGVDHVDFQSAPAGSGSWTTIATATTSPYSVSFDTTAVADGHYDFRTVAYDVAGNQAASAPVPNRLVDNTPPTATLNDPGAYLRGAVGLTSSTSDPGGSNASGIASVAYEYSTNGGTTWQSTGSTFDSTSVSDGNVDLHVVATDNAGNTTVSSPLTKLVDNTKPSTTDNAPSGWQSSPVTVTLTGSDAGSGVNVTEYSVDGNPSYTVGTSVVIPAPSDGSNDGAHTIAYFSVDNAGNIETVKSATVLIDATPPACPSCTAADYLRGTVTLSANPTAGSSGIQSVTFQYTTAGGSTWTTIGTATSAPYTAAWDTTAVADGAYDLRIQITNNANNVTTTDLPNKVVDNTAPNVAAVGAPTQGQLVTGTVSIAASAADATSPVASVDFFVNGAQIGTATTAPFSLNWDTTGVPDGAATIQVVVTDMAGNSATSAIRDVTVDNVAPTPVLADPGQNLSGTVALSASSDPDTTQVDFERRPAGGGSWTTIASDSSTPWGTSLDTTTLPDGLYDFRVVATDGTGHVGTSPLRSNVRIDNTAPSGSLTAPIAGATVGGTNVTLSSSASDSGSGVASVSYVLRPTGGGAFTPIASSSSAPFTATWDATTVSTGSYDLRAIVTDQAGNTFTTAIVTFTVDVTAPTVTLTSPGATIAGTVTLNATVSGPGATKVVFGATPTGGATWTALGTDTTAPWSIAFDTTTLADGVYDLRATVTDTLGNTSQDVVTGVRVDNTAPHVVSSSPADGSTVGSANAISLVASEPATPVGVTLDGGATVAPVISGTHIDYNTGALPAGAHVLSGQLQDPSGKIAPFSIHFTVGSSGPVSKNASPSSSTTVTSSDGFGSVTVPAGAWSASGNDWLVIRIARAPAPTGLTNGFGSGPEALDVTAYWALAGTQVHQFSQPLEIVIHSTQTGLVPATFENGAWRVIHRVPTPGSLPSAWDDGFFTAADGVHVLTKHLSLFALLQDLQAPQAPQNVRGYVGPNGLTIRWLPGSDNSGTYDYVTVFADSSDTGHYDPDYTAATVAGWQPGDNRIFRLQETDLAGNTSDLTAPLQPVPSLVGLTPDQAEAVLAARGLTIGTVTVGGTGKPGTITGPEGLALAPQGAAIDVTVAAGGASGLVFKVVTAPKLKPKQRTTLAARVLLTRAATVTAQLISPRHARLYTWHYKLRAGQTILRLRIPRQVKRPGIYTLRWSARAGRQTATRTIRFRLVGRRAPLQRIEIVLAGTAAKLIGGNLGRQARTVVTSVDPTFDAAANRNRDVRVIVVDADELGVATVRDLHIVFPSVKIVALAAGPKTMAAALRAGATTVLPRTTPPATVAKIVQRLAKKP